MSLTTQDPKQAQVTTTARALSARFQSATSRDEALEIAVQEAETSMKALKLTKDPLEKTKLSARVKQLLQDAEHIKFSDDWRSVLDSSTRISSPQATNNGPSVAPRTASRIKGLLGPDSSRALPKAEQILLYKASYLNGFKFPPWTTPPAPDEFVLTNGQHFVDEAELPLSAFQREVLSAWERPAKALPPPSWLIEDKTSVAITMKASRKIDLVQDAATDCSVVASICAGVARGERGHARILRAVMYPYDEEKNTPMLSSNGKYIVRLNFNGCHRRVVIDDRLPTSKTSRVIHVVDRRNPGLVWPALLEKAYLKVRGGYDFPGSNSGTDLWILTGWIPEQVFLQSEELDPERLWQRMHTAFGFGDVLLTMGTGKMSAKAEKEIGLAGQHDYAVLDLREVDGQRLMLIKNPWCEGTSWRGPSRSTHPQNGEEPCDGQSLAKYDESADEPLQSSRDLLNADAQLYPGTFWMDLDGVVQYFESIYLNWNPGLFAFRQDIHFGWDLALQPSQINAPKKGRFASLKSHPQFAVSADKGGTIWLLLCKHFKNVATVPANESPGNVELDLKGFISLYAFAARGRRVLMADQVREKTNFVDSPQILLKLEDCEPNMPYTIVPGEQKLPETSHTFTINAFSNSKLTLGAASQRYPCSQTLTAAWTKDTAGGNAHSPRYSTNPQFALSVHHRTRICILLEAASDELNVHTKLVYGKGQRVRAVRNRDIMFDSSDYRRRCCVAEAADVDPGVYTIICSTFEPEQLGSFSLSVESDQPAQLTLLPREGAGRLRLDIGAATFTRKCASIAVPLTPKRLLKLNAVARASNPRLATGGTRASGSLIRLTIEVGHGIHRRTLIASGDGEYSDSSSGPVQTNEIDLSPDLLRRGDLWLVCERMVGADQAQEERFTVELLVDQPGALECGAWRAWDD